MEIRLRPGLSSDGQFGEGVEPVAVQEDLVVGEYLGFEVKFAAELVIGLEHRLDDGLVLAPVRIWNGPVLKQGRCDRARHARSQAAPAAEIGHGPGPVEVEKLQGVPRGIGSSMVRWAVPSGRRLASAHVHATVNTGGAARSKAAEAAGLDNRDGDRPPRLSGSLPQSGEVSFRRRPVAGNR